MENAWSNTSNDAIDGVSLHWFPKDLNLRKILTSKVKIKRGNWTGSSDSSGTLLLRTPKPPGRASAWSWRSGTEWSHFVTEMHVNASGRIEWNYHSNTYYAIMGGKYTDFPVVYLYIVRWIDKLYIPYVPKKILQSDFLHK